MQGKSITSERQEKQELPNAYTAETDAKAPGTEVICLARGGPGQEFLKNRLVGVRIKRSSTYTRENVLIGYYPDNQLVIYLNM